MIRRTNPISPPKWAVVRSKVTVAGFSVIEEFAHEGRSFSVAVGDLSHRPKALIQGEYVIRNFRRKAGDALWHETGFVGLTRADEAIVFDLKGDPEPRWPSPDFTDMTEGLALLCVYGEKSGEIAERLFPINIWPYEKTEPIITITKYGEIKVWVVNPMSREEGFFLLCARSHAQGLYDACLDAGKEIDIMPVGLREVDNWVNQIAS